MCDNPHNPHVDIYVHTFNSSFKNKLKYFFRRIKMKTSDFYEMEIESQRYKNMMKCISLELNAESIFGYGGQSSQSPPTSPICVVTVRMKDLLNAGGIRINRPVEWDIKN